MIAVARQLLPVSCEWAGDLRHAGHNQDPSDLGDHSPDGGHVIGRPAYLDGIGMGSISVLDAATS